MFSCHPGYYDDTPTTCAATCQNFGWLYFQVLHILQKNIDDLMKVTCWVSNEVKDNMNMLTIVRKISNDTEQRTLKGNLTKYCKDGLMDICQTY